MCLGASSSFLSCLPFFSRPILVGATAFLLQQSSVPFASDVMSVGELLFHLASGQCCDPYLKAGLGHVCLLTLSLSFVERCSLFF